MTPLEALRFDCAERVLHGARPYVDFWDWSQPFAYAVYMPAVIISGWFKSILGGSGGCSSYECGRFALNFFSSLIMALSLAFSSLVLRKWPEASQSVWPRSLALTGAIALAALVCFKQAGDLQFAFVLTLLPWLLMRFSQNEYGLTFKNILVSITLLAGCGIALDAPFALVLIVGEVYFLLTYGRKAFAPMLYISLALIQVGQLALFSALFRESVEAYRTWIMPMRLSKWFYFDSGLLGTSCPDSSGFLYLFAATMAVAAFCCRGKDASIGRLIGLIATVCVAGFALFMSEGEGLSSDLVIAKFMLVVLMMLCFWALLRLWSPRRPVYKSLASAGLVGALVAGTAACGMIEVRSACTTASMVERLTGPGEQIAVFAQYPDAAYPLLNVLNRQNGSYLLWSRPMRMLCDYQYQQPLPETMFNFQTFLMNKIASQFTTRTASLILIERHQSGLMTFFRLNNALISNYENVGVCTIEGEPYCTYRFEVWRRK